MERKVYRMVADIDRTLNNAWQRSHDNGVWAREYGGAIVRNIFGSYRVANLRTDNNPATVDVVPPLFRTTHAEFHTHPDGVPFSIQDVTAMFHHSVRWDVSIVEAGSKRFALEITDRGAFENNLLRNSFRFNRTVDRLERLGHSTIDSHLYALREISRDPRSGITVYQSIDSNKFRLKEL